MKNALLLFVIFIAACSPKKDNKPSDLIVADSMVSIMIDIHIAEASMPAMQIYGEKMNEVSLEHYDHIYKLHNITAEQFKDSYNYYVNHPREFKDIYDEVVRRLERMTP